MSDDEKNSNPIIDFFMKNEWVIILIIGSIVVAYASVAILGKNNPIELEVEKVIEAQTGVHVDLTP